MRLQMVGIIVRFRVVVRVSIMARIRVGEAVRCYEQGKFMVRIHRHPSVS